MTEYHVTDEVVMSWNTENDIPVDIELHISSQSASVSYHELMEFIMVLLHLFAKYAAVKGDTMMKKVMQELSQRMVWLTGYWWNKS